MCAGARWWRERDTRREGAKASCSRGVFKTPRALFCRVLVRQVVCLLERECACVCVRALSLKGSWALSWGKRRARESAAAGFALAAAAADAAPHTAPRRYRALFLLQCWGLAASDHRHHHHRHLCACASVCVCVPRRKKHAPKTLSLSQRRLLHPHAAFASSSSPSASASASADTHSRTLRSSLHDASRCGRAGFHETALTGPVCPSSRSRWRPVARCQR